MVITGDVTWTATVRGRQRGRFYFYERVLGAESGMRGRLPCRCVVTVTCSGDLR